MTLEDRSLDVFRNYDSVPRDMEGAHTRVDCPFLSVCA